jgi:DNA-directed RNA polymerase II subunit RPB4
MGHGTWADSYCVLGSLCCDGADECKTLIPSLQDKISDEDLQELLNEMGKLMST